MGIDLNKIIVWLKKYLVDEEVDGAIEKHGINETVKMGIQSLIVKGGFLEDYLRKELSVELERIIHIDEFERLKNYGL